MAREGLNEFYGDRLADDGKSGDRSVGIRDSRNGLFWGDRSNFWQSNRFFAISSAVGVCGLIVFTDAGYTHTASAA